MLIKGDRKFRVNPPSLLYRTSVAVPTLRAKTELSAFPFSNNRATTSKMFKPSSFCLTGHHNPVTMTSEKLHGTNRQQSSTLGALRHYRYHPGHTAYGGGTQVSIFIKSSQSGSAA